MARTVRRGDQVVVVVSAMGKETDELLHLASQVSDTRPGREMDMLITAGERKAMALLCMALHDLGVPSDSFTGSQAGIITDTEHTKAKILEVRADRLREAAGRRAGARRRRRPGGVHRPATSPSSAGAGTDTTAVALAQALGADACEIYTDVSGVFTADPRVVPEARRLHARQLRGDAGDVRGRLPEAGDALGGVRPQPRGAAARALGFTWEPGTWIEEEDPRVEQAIISAVISDSSEAKLTVTGVPDRPGIAARLFRGSGRPLHQRRHDRAERVARAAPPTSPSPSPTRTWPRRSR